MKKLVCFVTMFMMTACGIKKSGSSDAETKGASANAVVQASSTAITTDSALSEDIVISLKGVDGSAISEQKFVVGTKTSDIKLKLAELIKNSKKAQDLCGGTFCKDVSKASVPSGDGDCPNHFCRIADPTSSGDSGSKAVEGLCPGVGCRSDVEK